MKMRFSSYLLAFLLSVVLNIDVLAQAPAADVAHPVTEVVRCTEIAFSRSVETRDRDAFKKLLDEDARFVGQGVLRGRDDVVAGWSVFFDNDYPRLVWRPSIIEVLDDGGLALSRGPYLMTLRNEEGELIEVWGLFNSVWRLNDDGQWRVVFDAGHEGSGPMPDDQRQLMSATPDCDD